MSTILDAVRPLATLDELRAAFPALERRHGGRPVAYFDGPGGTQVPRVVAESMSDYLLRHNANTHWEYPTSRETDAIIAGARLALADFLGAAPDEIAFGANMTTLAFHLARALGRGWGRGDEIVVTELDHQANVAPWAALERERGVRIRVAPMRDDGTLHLDALAALLGPHTRLVAVGAASNAIGTINEVGRVARLAHHAGALVFVDAVHYAAHALIDVRAMECDFLACSAYKFYGPHIGVLFGRRELLERLDVPKLAPAPEHAPDRLETGTLNHEGIAGAAAAVDFLAGLGTGSDRRARLTSAIAAIQERKHELFVRLWHGLAGIGGVRLVGVPPDGDRTPTVAFSIAGVDHAAASRALAERALFVSHGDFYATTAVARLGYTERGLIRAGLAAYTSADDVERLVDAVREVAGG